MNDSTSYLFDPTPYSAPPNRRRRRPRDPAVAAALARLGAALAELSPKEKAQRQARAVALGVPRTRR